MYGMKKNILSGVCIMCVCVMLLTSCAQEPAASVPSELQFAKGTEKPYLEPNDENFPIITDDYKYYIKKANIVKGKEPISYKNIDYSEIKITKTKTLPEEIKREDVDYMNDGTGAEVGDDGAILDDKTYLFVTTRITNKTDEKMLIPMQIRVVALDDELSYKNCSITNIYRSGKKLSVLKKSMPENKSYYMEYFEPGESTVYTIGTIVNDDLIDADNLYFILDEYYTDEESKQPGFEFEEDKAYKIN